MSWKQSLGPGPGMGSLYLLGGLGGGIVVALLSLLGYYKILQKKSSSPSQGQQIAMGRGGGEDIFGLLKKTKSDGLIVQELNNHPESALVTDHKGRLPLHIVLSKPQPNFEIGLKTLKSSLNLSLVQLLLNLYPEGAKIKDRFWQALPLHFCAHRDRDDLIDIRVVEIVLDAYPEATTITDGAHFLPIHRAGQ